jgi:hypothetical protein
MSNQGVRSNKQPQTPEQEVVPLPRERLWNPDREALTAAMRAMLELPPGKPHEWSPAARSPKVSPFDQRRWPGGPARGRRG